MGHPYESFRIIMARRSVTYVRRRKLVEFEYNSKSVKEGIEE